MPRGEELAQIGADLLQRKVAHGAGNARKLFLTDAVREAVFVGARQKYQLVPRIGRAGKSRAAHVLIDVCRVQKPVPEHLQQPRRVPDRDAVRMPRRDPLEDAVFEYSFVDGVGRAHADLTHAAADSGDARVLHLHDAPRVLIKGLSVLGERHVARIPPQKAHVHLPLQLRNAVGDGGLRDELVLCDAGKVLEFDKQQKCAKIIGIHD